MNVIPENPKFDFKDTALASLLLFLMEQCSGLSYMAIVSINWIVYSQLSIKPRAFYTKRNLTFRLVSMGFN